MINKMNMMAASMEARISQQEIIANNLANVNSAGFKKDRLFQDVIKDTEENMRFNKVTIFNQGSLRQTDNLTDIALQGEGFFTISTPDGIQYSRGGHFKMNQYGELVIENGLHVLGESGIISGQGKMTINEKGDVFFDGELVDKLRIVRFPENRLMQKTGSSLFMLPGSEILEETAEDVAVFQGFLEESNVQPVEEMVRMLTAFRYFEADQKVLTTQDDILRRAANDVGKV